MAIKTSGPISLGNIQAEFGGTAPHSLREYYRDGSYISKNNTKIPLIGSPYAPAINKFSNYYGAEFLVKIGYQIIAGGGGSGGWGNTAGTLLGGGGGGGGGVLEGKELWLPLGTYNVTVGLGGVAGAAKQSGSNGGNSSISHATRIMNTVAIGGGGGGGIDLPGKDGGSGGGGGLSSSITVKTARGGCVPGQGNMGGFGFSKKGSTFDGIAGSLTVPVAYRGSGGGGGYKGAGVPYEGTWGNWSSYSWTEGNVGGMGGACFSAGGGGSTDTEVSVHGYAPGMGYSQCKGFNFPGYGGQCWFKTSGDYVNIMNGTAGEVWINAYEIRKNNGYSQNRKIIFTPVNATLVDNGSFGPDWRFTSNGTFTISVE